jgi:hypothetical protein
MITDNWQKIFDSFLPHRAELARLILEAHNIAAVVLNKQDSSYHLFGKCELYVHKDNASLAKEIVETELPKD